MAQTLDIAPPQAAPPAGTPPAQTPPAQAPAPGPFDRDEHSPPIPTSIITATSILTGICILFSMALCLLVINGAMKDHPSSITIRLLMSCIACFVGLAFASLGFGLFLLRARGSFRARVDGTGSSPPALLESTAPGLIVIVCATVVMWLALRVRFEETTTTAVPSVSKPAQVNPTTAETKPVITTTTSLPHIQDGVTAP